MKKTQERECPKCNYVTENHIVEHETRQKYWLFGPVVDEWLAIRCLWCRAEWREEVAK